MNLKTAFATEFTENSFQYPLEGYTERNQKVSVASPVTH